MNNVEWVPIIMFMSIAFVIAMMQLFRYRARRDMQETIQKAIDKGHELTPELIDRLGEPAKKPGTDFRRGIIWLAVGAAFALFGLVLGEEDAVQPMLAVATFPAVIGIAFLLIGKFANQE